MKKTFYKILRFVLAYKFKKDYIKWSRWQFYTVPYRKSFNSKETDIECLVILPCKHLHDSGFRCMDFISIQDNKPKYRLSGCSDAIDFDGIGGYGYDWYKRYASIPTQIDVKAWSIDCLGNSGLLRIFSHNYKFTAGEALSSFELFANIKR